MKSLLKNITDKIERYYNSKNVRIIIENETVTILLLHQFDFSSKWEVTRYFDTLDEFEEWIK